eukprot:TRINITY_DN1867_c0_g1_i1.p1 TRINITY_DN1867_c0_g1~~TRINITY_DN1867_c0_g1_i1.p1  ORF type:complete len:215 (+),score=26.12 TRINITY_DN1867_c0_g1_i1:85-729(+)
MRRWEAALKGACVVAAANCSRTTTAPLLRIVRAFSGDWARRRRSLRTADWVLAVAVVAVVLVVAVHLRLSRACATTPLSNSMLATPGSLATEVMVESAVSTRNSDGVWMYGDTNPPTATTPPPLCSTRRCPSDLRKPVRKRPTSTTQSTGMCLRSSSKRASFCMQAGVPPTTTAPVLCVDTTASFTHFYLHSRNIFMITLYPDSSDTYPQLSNS